MNLIYIHTHDTGRFIEPYGYAVPTPNVMLLAREGTMFRNAYCAGPTCSPSRAGLLTGMAPHTCGMTGLAHRGFQLNDYSKHLVQFLNNNGFETVLCGIQHEAPRDEMIGYTKILHDQTKQPHGKSIEWDMENAAKAAKYIRQKKDKPFFMSFGMFNTHRPYPEISKEVNPNYVMPPFPVLDTELTRQDMAAYITSAKAADQCVGVILQTLKESGQEKDTMVIFTTDHGICFPKMKCHLYDTGIGVSLILKYPDNKKQGEVIDALISQLDIFPTLCDFFNLKHPDWLQGKSFLPILNGETKEIREEVFAEVSYHASYLPMRCIRTKRYKLIKFFDDHGRIVHLGGDDGTSDQVLMKYGAQDEIRDSEMLFDLYLDPIERMNRIHEDEYREIYQDLSNRLLEWMEDTHDPLLNGEVPLPKNAVIKKPSECNPNIL